MKRKSKIPKLNIDLSRKNKNFKKKMKLYKSLYNKIYYETYIKPSRKQGRVDGWLGKYRCPMCGSMSFLGKFQNQYIPEIILYQFKGYKSIKTYKPPQVPQNQEKLYLLYLISRAQAIFDYCNQRLKDLGHVFGVEHELNLSPVIQERGVRAPVFVDRKITLTKETDIPVNIEKN